MNTLDALRATLGGAKIDFSKIGLSNKEISRIVRKERLPIGPKALMIQEFLASKGYDLDERRGLPKEVIKIRELIFQGKISYEDASVALGYSRVFDIKEFINGKRAYAPRLEKAREIISKFSVTDQKEDVDHFEERSKRLEFAIFVLMTDGKVLTDESTVEERKKIRSFFDQNHLFEATSILCALNSEKARENRVKSTQRI